MNIELYWNVSLAIFFLNIGCTKDWSILAKPLYVGNDRNMSIDVWTIYQWMTKEWWQGVWNKETKEALIVRWPLTSIKRSEECRSNVRITDWFCFYSSTSTGAGAGASATGTGTSTCTSSGTGTGLICTRSARIDGISMNQIKSIKLYSKLISIEFPGMNQVDRHFEDLEYLNTINI